MGRVELSASTDHTVRDDVYGLHPFSSLGLDSRDIGWTSALLQRFTLDPSADAAELTAVPALTIAMTLSGRYTIGSVDGRGRAQIDQHAGALGMRRPGQADALRWRTTGADDPTLLRLQVPVGAVARLADELRGAGANANALASTLRFTDPVVAGALRGLDHAARDGAPDLVAETTVQYLVAHLLTRRSGRASRAAGSPGRRAVGQVRDLLDASLSEDISLDRMARAANVSPFHLIRLFKRHEGTTPYRYLLRLRLERGAELLRASELSVHEIALDCGFTDPGHFARQFRRRYGASPSVYRRG